MRKYYILSSMLLFLANIMLTCHAIFYTRGVIQTHTILLIEKKKNKLAGPPATRFHSNEVPLN